MNPQAQSSDINFTIPEMNSPSQFQPPTNNISREISLGAEIGLRPQDSTKGLVHNVDSSSAGEDLTLKNKFLETLLSIYELNPLRVNNYLVCHSNSLMELIKILTQADKVELIIDDDSGCTGCVSAKGLKHGVFSKNKYLEIQRILVTKDGKSNDLKYGYNDVYAQLVRYGVSLKLCI